MTIKYIRIQNFQSWEDVQFDLSKGINVFVGMSDRGKSAVARAIQWTMTNKPSGDEFRSDWGTQKEQDKRITRVDIMFDNDVCVSRLKGKTVNEYHLSTLDDPLIGFGTSVPQEVLDAFNMSEINIQTQDDPYFLFSESPPEIGRRLNKVASLSAIDTAFTNVASAIRTTNADITACRSSHKRESEAFAGFDWVGDAEVLLAGLETKATKVGKLRTTEMHLRNTKANIERLGEEIKKHDQIYAARNSINAVVEKITRLDEINTLLDKLEPIEEQLKSAESTIDEAVKLLTLEDDILALLDIIDERQEAQKLISELISKKSQIMRVEHALEIATEEEQTALAEWDARPDVCPLCGGDRRE
jgi:chromosome segregation ATPase